MLKLRHKFKLKKCIYSLTTLFYLSATIGSGVPPITNAFADDTKADNAVSNAQEMYRVAQGRENKDTFDKNPDEAGKKLDYQAMGVYLSNYFIPYQTTFDSELGDDGKTVKADKTMTDGLKAVIKNTTGMQDGDTVTNIISRTVGNMVDPGKGKDSASKPQQLYFGINPKGNGAGGTLTSTKADTPMPASYYDFLAILLGDSETLKDLKDRLHVTDNDKVSLYWGDGKTVMTFSMNPKTPTASQIAMSMIYKNASANNTISNSFLGNSKDSVVSAKAKDKETVQKAYNASMYGWKMYVDTYGDILVDNNVKRTVIMPAVMNPTLYTKTSKSGDDKVTVSTPKSYGEDTGVPINTVQGVQYLKNKDISGSSDKAEFSLTSKDWFDAVSSKKGTPWWSPEGDSLSKQMGYYAMSLSTTGSNDSDKNTQWSKAGNNKEDAVDKDALNSKYNHSANMLDQITYMHYMTVWNNGKHPYTAIGDDGKSLIMKNLSLEDILPTTARTVLIRTDTLNGINQSDKAQSNDKTWKVATDDNGNNLILSGNNFQNVVSLKSNPQFLNITSFHQLNSAYGKSGYNRVAVKLFKSYNNTILKDDSQVSYTQYPFRVNFSQPSSDNYVVIPQSQLPKTNHDKAISQFYNMTDSGKTDQNLAGSFDDLLSPESGGSANTLIKAVSDLKTDDSKTLSTSVSEGIKDKDSIPNNLLATTFVQALTPINGEGDVQGGDKGMGIPDYSLRFVNTPEFNMNISAVVKPDDKKDTSGGKLSTKKANELMDLSFNWLDPVGGAKYIATWISNKMIAITYDLHSRITGSNSSSYYTGSGLYKENNGFVYQPKMEDTGFTASIKDHYNKWAIYLIVAMFMAIALYVIRGDFSIQKGIIQFLIFCLFISIPIKMTDTIIGVSNTVSSSFFTKKFNYFAIFQLENSAVQIDKGIKDDNGGTGLKATTDDSESDKDSKDSKDSDTEDLSKSNLEEVKLSNVEDEGEYEMQAVNASNNENASGVSLRWMAPRKDNYSGYFSQTANNNLLLSGWSSNIFSASANVGSSKQKILGTSNNLYITRQLSDVTAVSRVFYNNILGSNMKQAIDSYSNVLSYSDPKVAKPVSDYLNQSSKEDDTLSSKEKNGFVNLPKNKDVFDGGHKHVLGAISSLDVANSTKQSIGGTEITPETKFGIPTEQFNATKEIMSKTPEAFKTGIDGSGDRDDTSKDEKDKSNNLNLNPSTVAGTTIYGLYSESPYYHFSWALMDYGMASDFKTSGTTKNLLLGDGGKKSDFFYNKTIKNSEPGYDELKDFTDLSSLFHVTIPYLHKLNQEYQDFVDKYGLHMYDHIPLTGAEKNGIKTDNPDYYKYWYNYNLARLQNQYTPWVDYMYASDYSKAETIKYSGKTVKVTDPLNPESYLNRDDSGKVQGRPMVFSKSEMEYYGLQESNLTTVEQKILKFNENARMAMLPLMNYYTFHDSTMTSVLAMTQLFEFNKVFSQTGLFGSKGQLTLEPQSWSTSDFSYDAYMRLILANSTGESLSFISSGKDNDNRGSYEVDAGDDINKQDSGTNDSYSDASKGEITTGNIYERVLAKSNWFLGILLVISDIISVYILTLFRYIFLVGVLALSVLILITLILTTEADLKSLVKKSILMPLLKVVVANILFAFIISRFLSNGYTKVTGDLEPTVTIGVGATLVAILVLETLLMLLYYNVVRKMIQDMINIGQVTTNSVRYLSSVATGVVTSAVGAGGVMNMAKSTFSPKYSQQSSISNEDLYGSKTPKFSSRPNSGSSASDTSGGTSNGTRPRFGSKPDMKKGFDGYSDQFQSNIEKGKQRLNGNNKGYSEQSTPEFQGNDLGNKRPTRIVPDPDADTHRQESFKSQSQKEYEERQRNQQSDNKKPKSSNLSDLLKRGRYTDDSD